MTTPIIEQYMSPGSSAERSLTGPQTKRPSDHHTGRAHSPDNTLIAGRFSPDVHGELPRPQTLIKCNTCNFRIDEMAHDTWGPMLEARTSGTVHPVLEWQTERVSD